MSFQTFVSGTIGQMRAIWNGNFAALTDTTDPTNGAALVGFKQSGTGAVARTVDTRLKDVVSSADFGVPEDNATSATVTLQAAVTAAAGRTLVIRKPATAYRLTGTVSIPSATRLLIEHGTRFEVPAGSTFPMFDLDGVTNVTISGGATIGKAAGTALSGNAFGVYIRGNAADVTIEGLTIDGFVAGVYCAGELGTVAGTCRRITLRNVIPINSPSTFGIEVDDTDTLMLDNCYPRSNWLDGFKLRRKTFNVTVLGGASTANGTSGTGDGMDAYAGGDTFVITDTIFDGNSGSGLTIKGGDLNTTTGATYGYVRNFQLANIRCRNNTNGMGAYITVNVPGTLTEAPAAHGSIIGGQFEGNSLHGLYINGRNIVAVAPIVRKNQQHGILTGTRAFDVELVSPIVVANSQTSAGTYDGINIAGTRIRVRGGVFIGADTDVIAQDSDYAAATKYHSRNVNVTSAAVDVLIDNPISKYNATAQGIICNMTSGVCVINQHGTGNPNTTGAYGSIGSTWRRTDGAGDALWIKTSGNPNAATSGWTRVFTGLQNAVNLDFPSIAAAGQQELTVTVTGATSTTADIVVLAPPAALPAGLVATGYVSAADTVTVRLSNITAGAIDPVSALWGVGVLKR